MKNTKNIHQETNKHKSQSSQVFMQSKAEFYSKSCKDPYSSIHFFDYQRINTILSKWVSVKNQNLRIKNHINLLLMQINPILSTSQVA